VCFVNKELFNLQDIAASVPGRQTNIRAELNAILLAITYTQNLPQKLIIRTDSELSIKSIKYWYKKWKINHFKNSTGKDAINLDLIEEIISRLENRNYELSWVRAHCGY